MGTDEKYLRKRFDYYPSYGSSVGWLVDTIRSAIVAHDSGEFEATTFLIDALHRDARILNADGLRCATVAGFALEQVCAGRVPQWVQRDVASLFAHGSSAAPPATRKVLQSGGYMQGFKVGQLVWDPSPSSWGVKLQPWPSDQARYDCQEQTWKVMTISDGWIPIKHGDGKWIVHEPMGVLGFRRAIVRAIALDWADRVIGKRHRSQHGAAHGAPVPMAELPSNITTTSPEGKAVQKLVDGLLQGRRGGVKPFGVKIDYLEAGTLAYEIYRMIIDGAAGDSEIAILGSDGMTQNSGGTNAKAHLIDGVRYDIVEDDALSLDWTLSTGLVAPYLEINHGEGISLAIRHLIPDPEEDARRAAVGATWQGFAKSVRDLRLAGIAVTEELVRRIARQHGVDADTAALIVLGELPQQATAAPPAAERSAEK